MSNEITGKALAYVEVDLDVYRITVFENEPVAAGLPRNWVAPWNATFTPSVVADAAMPSGKALRFVKSAGVRSMASWSAVPAIRDVSCVALLKATAANSNMNVTVRGSGVGGAETGYSCALFGDTSLILYKTVAGADTALATVAFAHAANVPVWMRLDAIDVSGGVLLRAKAWFGDVTDEPDTFAAAFTEVTTLLPAGFNGVQATSTNSPDFRCGLFRVRSVFSNVVETLRFVKSSDYLPLDIDAIPSLLEVQISPGAISLGENLGERATMTAAFKDHKHSDLGELYNSGTYWGRFRARQLFRKGQPMRYIRGLLGQSLASMETRHFVLDSFNGPSFSGAFQLVGKDPLKLADDDRALAPRPNTGSLNANITNVAVSLTLSPGGIGNAEYPASGFAAIGGKEIVSFTRAADVMTIVRAQFGTTAIAHSSEDRVQTCLIYTGQTPADIIRDLFVNYAAIDPAWINLTVWQNEVDTFLDRLYTKVIADPVGVKDLVSNLIQQAGLAVWSDLVTQNIRLQVLRGITTDAFVYSQRNVLSGSISVSEQPEKQKTQCWTYYGVRNPTEPRDRPDNYRSGLVTIEGEIEALNGGAVIQVIFGDWIPAFGRQTAQRVNDLQIGRFGVPPRKVQFDVMRYSGVEEPQLGGGYQLTYWGGQSEIGGVDNIPLQIIRLNPQADKFTAEGEEMLFVQQSPTDLINRVILFDSSIDDVDLRTVHDSIYPVVTAQDVIDGVNLTVLVGNGAIVGASVTSERALDIGSWPVGFLITLEVQSGGRIQGCGGNGGHGGSVPFGDPQPGFNGGVALYTRFPISLNVVAGKIYGGAGGGGAGTGFGVPFAHGGGGGGGGAGKEGGAGGPAGEGFASGSPGTAGAPGTPDAGGAGGLKGGSGAQPGAPGGGPGLAGSDASDGGSGFILGGSPGAAIDGISFVTVTFGPGDIRGPQVN